MQINYSKWYKTPKSNGDHTEVGIPVSFNALFTQTLQVLKSEKLPLCFPFGCVDVKFPVAPPKRNIFCFR